MCERKLEIQDGVSKTENTYMSPNKLHLHNF